MLPAIERRSRGGVEGAKDPASGPGLKSPLETPLGISMSMPDIRPEVFDAAGHLPNQPLDHSIIETQKVDGAEFPRRSVSDGTLAGRPQTHTHRRSVALDRVHSPSWKNLLARGRSDVEEKPPPEDPNTIRAIVAFAQFEDRWSVVKNYLQSYVISILIAGIANLAVIGISKLVWRPYLQPDSAHEMLSTVSYTAISVTTYVFALQAFTNVEFLVTYGAKRWLRSKMLRQWVLSTIGLATVMAALIASDWPYWFYYGDCVILVVYFAIGAWFAGYYGCHGEDIRTNAQNISDANYFCAQDCFVAATALVYADLLLPIYGWLSDQNKIIWRLSLHPFYWEMIVKFVARRILVTKVGQTWRKV
ncbi:hypothetical protein BDK51DRAFT_49357 [Blyttiomyces helicus]|uniref:Uncharacterized protein n=1 Tax=Blyttiomyces helicus TaxID=388810 RepID=A0A4P9W0W1_9FUNG|nr:hypothetical protein BDK51DRAFT_49357 [Blyttiomyces helicus]|eukprot:RKO84200.1 hypothetical protein BDK51DRAFT_49357 [Blyttiomyces helicus]